MKYIFFCYRSWAIKATVRFIKKYQFEYKILSTKEYEEKFPGAIKKNVIQIDARNQKQIFDILNTFQPNHIFLIGWSWIINHELINKFSIFCFHPSDLPKYRGGSPIQHQILDNITKTKMTLFKINKYLDGGPIFKKKTLYLNTNMKNIFCNLEETTFALLQDFNATINKKKKVILNKQILKQGFIRKRIKLKKSFLSLKTLLTFDFIFLKNLIRSLESPYPNLKILILNKTYRVKSVKDISRRYKKGYKKIKILNTDIYLKLSALN